MKVQDLGNLVGPVWVYGGVYSNLQAFHAFQEAADKAAISISNRICTGDIVAYCADAEACAQGVRAMAGPVLAGNCEKQLSIGAVDCGCGFDDGSTCSTLARGWYAHALSEVSSVSKLWMADLPDRIIFSHAGLRYGIVHGGASDISRFLWSVTPANEMAHEIDLLEQQIGAVDRILSGHSGVPMARNIGKKLWLNAGAIGMPSNDHSAHTSYLIIKNKSFEFKRLAYKVDGAIAAMKAVGLTQGYHKTLRSGLWPSEDSLPIAQRHNKGQSAA